MRCFARNKFQTPPEATSVGFEQVAIRVFLLAVLLIVARNSVGSTRGISLTPVENTAATPFVNGIYRALIIGNNDYRDPQGRWLSLETAANDATALAAELRSNYGFSDVVLLKNATRSDILNEFDSLARRVLPRDSVLVYYAGHGWLDAGSNRGYWVPVDADGVDHTTFVRNSTIRDELSLINRRSKHTLLISDSCFSGTLLRSGSRGISTVENNTRYFRSVANKKSVQILAAGGVEYVDDNYRQSGHSPFTYFLLNELRLNNNPLISASELSASVRRAVANNADQTPESGVLQGAGDELGEFLFLNININVSGDEVAVENVEILLGTEKQTLDPAAEKPLQDTRPAELPRQSKPIPLPTL